MLKKPTLLYVIITDPQRRLMFEDPISLSPCLYPIKTKCFYSWDILSKVEAEQLINLNRNTCEYRIELDEEIEQSIANVEFQILRSNLSKLKIAIVTYCRLVNFF